jgi:hypothetical protein
MFAAGADDRIGTVKTSGKRNWRTAMLNSRAADKTVTITLDEALRASASDAVPRPASARFEPGRFDSALKKMDAIVDESDTVETWDSVLAGIHVARGSALEGD